MAEKIRAEELAKKQREISISEFFTKNRHLLGFDKPTRALLMAVKEAVDNSVDACDETNVLPDIYIELKKINEERFVVIGTSGSSDEVSHLWEAVEVSDILNKHSTAKVIEDFISSKISEYEKQQRKRNLKPSRRSQLEALHHSQYHP